MNSIEGIEGDYIETKDTNLFFDVKGILHPDDYLICFLRFFPQSDGERIKNRIKYKKVYDLKERYSLLRERYPQYLFYSKELDLQIQGVKRDEIKKIYTPRAFFQDILVKEELSNVEILSKELCELFISKGNLSDKSIGITGSLMVGLNTEESDIDIIIYGTANCLKFQEELTTIFERNNNLRKYNLDEFRSHYHWRVGGSGISFEDFLEFEKRKQHQGKFKNYDFYIRYIKSPEDWHGNYYDFKYTNYGRIKLIAEIIDSTDSIFTPCSYKIKPQKILQSSIESKDFNIGDIKEICSFRGRFCENAKEEEKVLVEGKLEKVNFKNSNEYFRILLTDQVKDKMLIIK
ncbi:MAG: nucleotidyltransferase domain-containing protein [Promethearchaeota archaeon]|jgi:predicted nucleotidyltransferase